MKVIGDTATIYNYEVSVFGEDLCASDSRKPVSVQVNPYFDTDLIKVEGKDSICAGESTSLTVTADEVVNPVFHWYLTPDTDEPVNPEYIVSDAKSSTLTTGSLLNDTTFYVTVEGENYCEDKTNKKAVKITVHPLPKWDENALPDIIACAGGIGTQCDSGSPADSVGIIFQGNINGNPGIHADAYLC